ncbi:hypothetical protein [Arthrobacter sp. D2-10]
MKLKIINTVGGHKVGDEITTTEGAGSYLINAGYAEQVETKAKAKEDSDGKPAGNASLEEWTAYALANGKTEEDLKDLKRDDVRALFTE